MGQSYGRLYITICRTFQDGISGVLSKAEEEGGNRGSADCFIVRTPVLFAEYNEGMSEQPIGIFDSGVGGLKILAAARKVLRRENFIYVFDRSHAPYGNRSNRYIKKRAEKVSAMLIKEGAKAIVVACNTATNVGISRLREKFGVPFVGVEPPVKPAAVEHKEGKILVLCTCLTAVQDKFLQLKNKYDDGSMIVVPLPDLARNIERNFTSLKDLKPAVDDILRPYDNENVESVVLGCTHYYYVADLIAAHFGGNVRIYDACEGVAERLKNVLEENDLFAQKNIGKVRYIYI